MSKHSLITCLGLLLPLQAWAYGSGIVGYSGKVASQTCTSCHGVGAGTAPTVTLTGPATLNPGQSASYTLTIAGGPGVRGGMNVATSSAGAVLTAGSGSAKEGAELRHASPLAFSGGQASWTFTVTAPTSGSFTLFGAGNSCNGSGTGGDRSAYVTKVVTVNVVNQPPAVAVPAGAAATSPTTQALSVGATDDGGESNLTYTWAATTAPAPVTFSVNGTNAAKNTTATFTRAGSYVFTVTIRDAQNLTTTSTANVNVAAQVMSVSVAPPSVGLATGRTQQFTASGVDQFGAAMSPPPSWTWSATGGSINAASGLFTAGSAAGGPFTVTAASGGKTGTAQVTVSVGSPPTVATAAASSAPTATSVTLTVLGADDGGEGNLSYTWIAEGAAAAVAFSVNGNNAAKRTVATFSAAGSYTFTVVIRDLANLTATSSVPVVVNAALQAVSVTPATAVVPPGGTRQLTATAEDQFGNPVSPAPGIEWAVAAAAGTISPGGLFRAASTPGGPYTVTATAGSHSGSAVLNVNTGGAPQVAMAPTASPATVLGKSTLLRVLGSDDGGEAGLTYTWAGVGPALVSFSENGTNAAKNTTASFTRAGSYTLTVTLTDPTGMSTEAALDVTVAQTLLAITVSPSAINVSPSGTQIFAAVAVDQFGEPHLAAPQVSWTVSGGGAIDGQGMFTARDTEGGPFTVTASAGAVRGTAITRVGEGPSDLEPPSVTLGELPATLSGTVKLTVNAQDNVGVTQVTWVLDGKPLGTVTAAPFDFILRTRALENGEHLLEAIAQDAALNSARSPQLTVVVSNEVLQELEPVVGVGCSSTGSAPFALLALLCGLWLAAPRRARR